MKKNMLSKTSIATKQEYELDPFLIAKVLSDKHLRSNNKNTANQLIKKIKNNICLSQMKK